MGVAKNRASRWNCWNFKWFKWFEWSNSKVISPRLHQSIPEAWIPEWDQPIHLMSSSSLFDVKPCRHFDKELRHPEFRSPAGRNGLSNAGNIHQKTLLKIGLDMMILTQLIQLMFTTNQLMSKPTRLVYLPGWFETSSYWLISVVIPIRCWYGAVFCPSLSYQILSFSELWTQMAPWDFAARGSGEKKRPNLLLEKWMEKWKTQQNSVLVFSVSFWFFFWIPWVLLLFFTTKRNW